MIFILHFKSSILKVGGGLSDAVFTNAAGWS